jgi:hypothetical protein
VRHAISIDGYRRHRGGLRPTTRNVEACSRSAKLTNELLPVRVLREPPEERRRNTYPGEHSCRIEWAASRHGTVIAISRDKHIHQCLTTDHDHDCSRSSSFHESMQHAATF